MMSLLKYCGFGVNQSAFLHYLAHFFLPFTQHTVPYHSYANVPILIPLCPPLHFLMHPGNIGIPLISLPPSFLSRLLLLSDLLVELFHLTRAFNSLD